MNVLIACNGGVSTSILATRMNALCNSGDTISACQYSQVTKLARNFDAILLAPQIGSLRASIERACPGMIIGVIDARSYGQLDGAAVLAYASELIRTAAKPCDGNTAEHLRRVNNMKTVTITLACNGGVSTKMLCKKIIEAGLTRDLDIKCEAYSINNVGEHIEGSDVLLIGPQVKWMLGKMRDQFPNTPVEVIDMHDYGTMDGAAILDKLAPEFGW